MQRLQFALFQIDRAKALLIEGHIPALRVALMLADNAAEVLLDRWIDSAMEGESMHERVHDVAKQASVPPDHPDFKDLFARRRLKAGERQKIARFFDEKIRYATETKGAISSALRSVLSHSHRYRNQAHHSGKWQKRCQEPFDSLIQL
ncbi:MAG: hypothetical protein L0Z68_05615 [Gammaproteobacteria bacterium]|nr:hypothetical protein [Gammaproteobacteria bacterium]